MSNSITVMEKVSDGLAAPLVVLAAGLISMTLGSHQGLTITASVGFFAFMIGLISLCYRQLVELHT